MSAANCYRCETFSCTRSLRKYAMSEKTPLSKEEHERYFLGLFDWQINGVKEARYRYEVLSYLLRYCYSFFSKIYFES